MSTMLVLPILVIGDGKSLAKDMVNTMNNKALQEYSYKGYRVDIQFEYIDPHDIPSFNYTTFPQKVEQSYAVIYTFAMNSTTHWREHAEFIREAVELSEKRLPVLLVGSRCPDESSSQCITAPFEVIEYINQVDESIGNLSFIETDYGTSTTLNTLQETQYLVESTLEEIRYTSKIIQW
jgi:hypothetical protein